MRRPHLICPIKYWSLSIILTTPLFCLFNDLSGIVQHQTVHLTCVAPREQRAFCPAVHGRAHAHQSLDVVPWNANESGMERNGRCTCYAAIGSMSMNWGSVLHEQHTSHSLIHAQFIHTNRMQADHYGLRSESAHAKSQQPGVQYWHDYLSSA